MRNAVILFTLFAAACAAAPTGPPEDVASALIEDLDAGREGAAGDRFEAVADDASYREKIYPILYGTARDRYRQGDPNGAVRILRFMEPHYPEGTAVREALLYSLFLERAQQTVPEPGLTEEIGTVLAQVRSGETTPLWVDLVATQHAIDRGELAESREALGQFLSRWEGDSPELILYVEDLERYLRTH